MKKIITALAISGTLLFGMAQGAEAKTKPSLNCKVALNSAETVINLSAEFSRDVSTFFQTVSDSARSRRDDVVGFLNDMTAATNALTPQIHDITARVDLQRSIYKPAAAKCRAGK